MLGIVLAGRVDGEGQAEHGDGAGRGGGSARHAGAQRAAARDQREALELPGDQVLDDGDERGVELCGWSGRLAPRHEVGLLYERHARAQRLGLGAHGDDVLGADPAPGAVAHHERGLRVRHGMHVRPGRPVWGLDLHQGSTGVRRSTPLTLLSRIEWPLAVAR